jgi:FAD/FMN-containing dehydrogenase
MKALDLFYDPGDMTMCVAAETPIAEVNERAAADELTFPLYLDPTSTIGDLILHQPFTSRSYRFGPVADNVLGMNFVPSGGEPIKIGGQVVKNVTGFDFTRFLCYSGSRFGKVERVVLRLRACEVCRETRVLTGQRAALDAFRKAIARNAWGAVLDALDGEISEHGARLVLQFSCAAEMTATIDRVLADEADEHGLALVPGEAATPASDPFVRIKTTLSRALATAGQLVEHHGGSAHAFLGNGYLHYEPASRTDPALRSALLERHRECGAVGGHLQCADIADPDDTIQAGWENQFRERLAALA